MTPDLSPFFALFGWVPRDLGSLIALAILLPLVPFVTNLVLKGRDTGGLANLRDTITFLAAVALAGVVYLAFQAYWRGGAARFEAWELLPGLTFAFGAEPLGLLFAAVASGLWTLTHLYGLGYMRGNREKRHGRFFASFCVAISATMGIAFADNLFTLFVFYEILTVSTYPLVAHKENDDARAGGRTYLGILMTTSIVFLLTAIIWTSVVAGTLDFRIGGILSESLDATYAPWLLALFAFGIGKAAIMPIHRWLPAAMVAPTPVSALLHAVAVVKAGVFTMLKVGVYVFGTDYLRETGASVWLAWLAAFSIVAASIVAMTKDNLKARLAYSTVSQLSYITLGMALASAYSVVGGALHIATHAVGKITLFMCAGAIYVATHRTLVSELDGLGRQMPFTFAAFGVAALSIIGVPPLFGAWSKWLLTVGAWNADQAILIGVFVVSSLLNILYLMPIFARAFFVPARPAVALSAQATPKDGISEAPFLCVLPPVVTAALCVVLAFYAEDIALFLAPLAGAPR